MTDLFCNLGIMVIGPCEIEAETPIIALDLNDRDDCCNKNSHDCCNKNNVANVTNVANLVNANNVNNLANVIMGIENKNRCDNNDHHHNSCHCNSANLDCLQNNTQALIRDLGINVLTNC